MDNKFVRLIQSALLLGAFSTASIGLIGFNRAAGAQANDPVSQNQSQNQNDPSQAAPSQVDSSGQHQENYLDCPALQHALTNPAQQPVSCLYYTNHDQHNSTEDSARTGSNRGEHIFPSQDHQSNQGNHNSHNNSGRNGNHNSNHNSGNSSGRSGGNSGGHGGGHRS